MKDELNLSTMKEEISEITGLMAEEIDDDASLMQDIGLSSLELMSLLSNLEKKYHVSVSAKDLRKVVSLNDLVNLISDRLANASDQ